MGGSNILCREKKEERMIWLKNVALIDNEKKEQIYI